jgi:hypothetical protein
VARATLLGDDTPVRASERPISGSRFEQMLSGGDPRSLRGVEQVVAAALVDPSPLEALFGCLSCDDAVVRMRAGDALEKIGRVRPELLAPFARRLHALSSRRAGMDHERSICPAPKATQCAQSRPRSR